MEVTNVNGLLTAGEVAKRLRKITGTKITAKELRRFADERHRRTYCFRPETNLRKLAGQVIARRVESFMFCNFVWLDSLPEDLKHWLNEAEIFLQKAEKPDD